MEGVRFGKGHGFFDLEWGMFSDLKLVDENPPVVAVVHDVHCWCVRGFIGAVIDTDSIPNSFLGVQISAAVWSPKNQ